MTPLVMDICHICFKAILPNNWNNHLTCRDHMKLLPDSITVQGDFVFAEIPLITAYFSQFGTIVHATPKFTAMNEPMKIVYTFSAKSSYNDIIGKSHDVLGKQLEVSWPRKKPPPGLDYNHLKTEAKSIAIIKSNLLLKGEHNEAIRNYCKHFGTVLLAKFSTQQHFIIFFANNVNFEAIMGRDHQVAGRKITIEPCLDVNTYTSINSKPAEEIVKDNDTITYGQILTSLSSSPNFSSDITILLGAIDRNKVQRENVCRQVCYDLVVAMSKHTHRLGIHFFGSSLSGLDSNNSDLDVYISNARQIKDPTGIISLKCIHQLLHKSLKFSDIILLSKPKVPIIKCIHKTTKMSCDINVKDMLPIHNSHFMKYYTTLDEKVRPLIIVIKFWFEQHDLKNVNFFSGYSIYLMVIFYLQREHNFPSVAALQAGVEPIIEDGWNCAFERSPSTSMLATFREVDLLDVFKGFFGFYEKFDYFNEMICPFLGTSIAKVDFLPFFSVPDCYKEFLLKNIPMSFGTNHSLCIQDPFEHCKNTAASTSGQCVARFTSLCGSALTIFEKHQTKPTLHNLLTECEKNLRQFRIEMPETIPIEMFGKWKKIIMNLLEMVLKEVLTCTVCVQGPQKIFVCGLKQNVWKERSTARKALSPTFTPDMSAIDEEVAITKYVLKHSPEALKFSCKIQPNFQTAPIRGVELTCTSIVKKKYSQMFHYLRVMLPEWSKIAERELVPVQQLKTEIIEEANIKPEPMDISLEEFAGLDAVTVITKEEIPSAVITSNSPAPGENGINSEDSIPVVATKEQEEEDVPPDFFDDFSNKDFMDGLDIVDAWQDQSGAECPKKSVSPICTAPSESSSKRSRSPGSSKRRRRSKSLSKPQASESRRDPEKTRRDINRDKIRVAKDKLRIVETGLVPPGTELDTDNSAPAPKKRRISPPKSRSKERPPKSRSRERRVSPTRARHYVQFKRRYSPKPRPRPVRWSPEVRSRRRSPKKGSFLDELRKYKDKKEEAVKKKSFLEEIREKLNEVRPAAPYGGLPQYAPIPVPAPMYYGGQQYDQQFFIGDGYLPMVPNNSQVLIEPQIMPSPPIMPMNSANHTGMNPMNPILYPAVPSLGESVTSAPVVETISNKNIDKLFEEKKISLSDFLTITAKPEVHSSSPDHLKKKIKVISRCQDAIKTMVDDRNFTGRLRLKSPFPEPKTINETKYQSPLRRIPAVRFQFTSPAKGPEEDSFSSALDRVLLKIGLHTHSINGEKTEVNTVVVPSVTCAECSKRSSRQFSEMGSQCDTKEMVTIGIQVCEEDLGPVKGLQKNDSMAMFTPAQLLGKETEVAASTAPKPSPVKEAVVTQPPPPANKKKFPPKGGKKFMGNPYPKKVWNANEVYWRGKQKHNFHEETFQQNRPRGYPRPDQLGDGSNYIDFNQPFRPRNPHHYGPRF